MGRKRKLVLATVLMVFAAIIAPPVFANQKETSNSAATAKIENALNNGSDSLPASVTNGTSGAPQLQRRYPRYEIDSGDVIEIDFPYTPDFNQTVTVTPDGYISLRNAGGIHIAGETVPQIKIDIQKAYSKILRDPEVSITLKQFQNPYFLALGQVNKPGKYDLRGATTIAQAVAMAGGFTSKGKRNDIILFRRVSDNWVSATKVNLKHMLTSKNLSEDLQMHPGDMIFVPQNRFSKIKPFIQLPSLSYYLH
ncbi:MAG TPA: polysaccharide biosynthesis/export family protein [Chryseosolibacter sp.]|nr:polysaccharide biosynthesis/export family protein [Chryseosolibacter sp.]